MLPILERELVDKKHWTTMDDLRDYFSIGQCTPGIIALNVSTFIGEKKKGVPGALLATTGFLTGPIIIILIIASFLTNFAEQPIVQHAFAGIRVCVCVLIVQAVLRLWKKSIVDGFTLFLYLVIFVLNAFSGILPVRIPAAVLVIIAGVVGVLMSMRNRSVKSAAAGGASGNDNREKLQYLLSNEEGRKAINTALIANRKCKIGSNMMDIIVCGAIPPYNDLLGGKLISMLACSPTVIRDYTHRYNDQVSEIASRMKGKKVVRDSRLVYLGTTSLYAIGSSQYNRIKMPLGNGGTLEFRKMGITEGYGTVFFSKETTNLFSKILEYKDGGKRINHVFGEGTSPRFRMISRGLSVLGIRADAFMRHYSPRIVYSINLAKNTNEFLLGLEDDVDYDFDMNDEIDVNQKTKDIIEYWYTRWLEKRLTTVDIVDRLSTFRLTELLLGNI